MVAVGGRPKQFRVENRVRCDAGALRSRRRRADLRLRISVVIQGVGAASERRVAKSKSSRSGKQLEGFVMRGLELRSSMNFG